MSDQAIASAFNTKYVLVLALAAVTIGLAFKGGYDALVQTSVATIIAALGINAYSTIQATRSTPTPGPTETKP